MSKIQNKETKKKNTISLGAEDNVYIFFYLLSEGHSTFRYPGNFTRLVVKGAAVALEDFPQA